MCVLWAPQEEIRLSQRNAELQKSKQRITKLFMILDYVLALNNQSKQRHVASIVHYPIKTPPRAFYCALPNQTRPRFSIVHFAAQEKKKTEI